MDYYEILQVHPRADAAAIEAAYTRLRELYDPARIEGAADELVDLARQKREAIERAYAVLSDPARRATYDEEQPARSPTKDEGGKTKDQLSADDLGKRLGPSSLVAGQAEEPLDYRPLPPAGRTERAKGFDDQPVRPATPARLPGRATNRPAERPWVVPAALASALVLIVLASLALTGGGGPPPMPATPTPSPFDAFEASIPQAQQAAQQNPTSAQAWIDLGNLLYDSAQVVRERAPDSPIYQQRLGRWLEATNAYSQALALAPDNASVRADLGASACFYGAGTGDQKFVREGTDEVRRAAQTAPDDERVLLSLGHCLVSTQPPQTEEAIETWRRIIALKPSSPLATQAQLLIAKYSGQ
ncbi:MAG TPA: DnaJ domain-containing protein [Roseiflexaceae bacterium]|nr:DnaJ domain-containing protein [Roseiflexaceae bacterium]